MPLKYDDVDGSWGWQSDKWPAVQFNNEQDMLKFHKPCWNELGFGHGTYVLVMAEIRIETKEQQTKLYEYVRSKGIQCYRRG